MDQIEEQKRIHDAETQKLQKEILEWESHNTTLANANIRLHSENQALKSELEKQEENIATEFEATAYCDDQTNEMFMEYVDGVFDDLDGGTAYRVLILQKETE